MPSRRVNAAERYLLTNYQHLMSPADRMIAQALVAVGFELDNIPKSVWLRTDYSPNAKDRWEVPIDIALRLLKDHKSKIELPGESV